MTCDQVKEYFADYLAGTLSPAIAEELNDHFAACAACKQEAAQLSETWEMLGLLHVEQPGAALRSRFYQSLEAYREGAESAHSGKAATVPVRPARRPFFDWGWRGWAWSAALLVAGIAAGHWLDERGRSQADLARLQDEVQHMRQLVTLSLLEEQSASERLRGVDYANRVEQSDTQVLSALLHAVNYDPNVNVRLAAVDALRKFSASPSVRATLDQSLVKQNSPLVQIALIDLIVDTRDTGALPALESLQHNADTDKNVREKALWGVTQLQ